MTWLLAVTNDVSFIFIDIYKLTKDVHESEFQYVPNQVVNEIAL